ncbi:MAG: D-alanyl-D-alanine carboxypeptidase/D-alanyl-D-alanine-endopeptidase [Sphingobacteriales bacterium]|nr:D-alanyl-D-alanine carboxypeptidase/D-alanyl-D-alanine-endopeptidase [Sphingobacteriales bacterium]
MKKVILFWILLQAWNLLPAQTVREKLQQSFQRFMSDSQLKHAAVSLYVIDAKTGQPVFDVNSQLGLAPASTQKIITSVTAFELLGSDYRYKTEFWLNRSMPNYAENSIVMIRQSGDPTFGSNRYSGTKPAVIFSELSKAFSINKINPQGVRYRLFNNRFESQKIPDGWIFQDIGNYYGAGAAGLNWRENQTDIMLKAGKKAGDPVTIISLDTLAGNGFTDNQLKTGAPGSGDNAYYYFQYGNQPAAYPILKGTIPAGEENFSISIATADPFFHFANELQKNQLAGKGNIVTGNSFNTSGWTPMKPDVQIYTHVSPSLDSIIYWFNKKSINLYGEALVKTFAYEKQGFASTDSGLAIVKRFWEEKGLDGGELNLYDGSGLSPLNRVTTHAQVEILRYAKTKEWFPYFYAALPEYNGMKMKSGTISDVKGYCGYHQAKDGRDYIFSFLVNNYSGKSGLLMGKMYRVLDELK